MSQNTEQQRAHYIHRISYTMRERLVGGFLIMTLVLLLPLFIFNSKTAQLFERQIPFHAFFDTAEGISTDTKVKISGLEVGNVDSIEITGDLRIDVKFNVYERYRNLVREDSTASLKRLTIIGNQTLEISAGSPDQPELAAGASITTTTSASIDELLTAVEGITTVVNSVDPQMVVEIVADLKEISSHLSVVSKQLAAGEGFIGKALYDDAMSAQIADTLATANVTLNQASERLRDIKPLLDESRGLGTELRQTLESLPELMAGAGQAMQQTNALLKLSGEEMEQFPGLLTQLRILMEKMDLVMDGMQRIWPLSSAMEKPAGPMILAPQPLHEATQ